MAKLLGELNVPGRLSGIFKLHHFASKGCSAPAQIKQEIDRSAREVYEILQHSPSIHKTKAPQAGPQAFPIRPSACIPFHLGHFSECHDPPFDWVLIDDKGEIPDEFLKPLSRSWADKVAFRIMECQECRLWSKDAERAHRQSN